MLPEKIEKKYRLFEHFVIWQFLFQWELWKKMLKTVGREIECENIKKQKSLEKFSKRNFDWDCRSIIDKLRLVKARKIEDRIYSFLKSWPNLGEKEFKYGPQKIVEKSLMTRQACWIKNWREVSHQLQERRVWNALGGKD